MWVADWDLVVLCQRSFNLRYSGHVIPSSCSSQVKSYGETVRFPSLISIADIQTIVLNSCDNCIAKRLCCPLGGQVVTIDTSKTLSKSSPVQVDSPASTPSSGLSTSHNNIEQNTSIASTASAHTSSLNNYADPAVQCQNNVVASDQPQPILASTFIHNHNVAGPSEQQSAPLVDVSLFNPNIDGQKLDYLSSAAYGHQDGMASQIVALQSQQIADPLIDPQLFNATAPVGYGNQGVMLKDSGFMEDNQDYVDGDGLHAYPVMTNQESFWSEATLFDPFHFLQPSFTNRNDNL